MSYVTIAHLSLFYQKCLSYRVYFDDLSETVLSAFCINKQTDSHRKAWVNVLVIVGEMFTHSRHFHLRIERGLQT